MAAPASAESQRVHVGATQLLSEASQVLLSTTNFVIAGSLVEDGDHFSLTVESANAGSSVMASITSHTAALGFVGNVKIIEVAQQVYLDGSKPFGLHALKISKVLSASQINATVSVVASRWVTLPDADAPAIIGDFSSFTQPDQLAKDLLQGKGVLHEGEPMTFHGRAAIPITNGKSGIIYLAWAGSHLPLGVVDSSATISGEMLFGYPSSMDIAAPPNPLAL